MPWEPQSYPISPRLRKSTAAFGYFPTIRATTYGGYGAGNTATRVELGAADRMVNQALIRAYEFLGRLRETPEDLKRNRK